MLQLCGELMVLKDSQSRSGLKLLVIQSKEVGFGLLNLVKHFLSQLTGGLDFFSFHLVYLHTIILFFLSNISLKTFYLLFDTCLPIVVTLLLMVLNVEVQALDFSFELFQFLRLLLFNISYLFLLSDFKFVDLFV